MMCTHNKQTWHYALFSAHIHRYLPALSWGEHAALYQRWRVYHQPQPVHAALHWDTSLLADLKLGAPQILVLFHLGMHAFLPQVLADEGIQFDLLLDRKVFAQHQTLFAALQTARQEQGACYRFLMSDDPQVLLKARSAIQAGRHLLIFADGNSGTSDQIDKKVKISFLANDLFVRKGIALLSALLGASILPISHRTVAGHRQLLTGTAIGQLPNEKREVYIQRSMQLLYDFLSSQIRDEPWRWECWGYLHKLNCYQLEAPRHAELDLTSESNIGIVLQGRNGIFNREYFCCLFK